MKFLLGTKLGMTQIFMEDGNIAPATLIEAGPVVVTQMKSKDKDGYDAVQVGFGTKSKNKLSKSLKGHFRDLGSFRWVRECRSEEKLKIGDKIDVSAFNAGDEVTLKGVSKGKGFQDRKSTRLNSSHSQISYAAF